MICVICLVHCHHFSISIILTYSIIYLVTYLLTPCSIVLLEKLIGFKLVKKFSAFHGTRRFITAFASVRHLSLFWASTKGLVQARGFLYEQFLTR